MKSIKKYEIAFLYENDFSVYLKMIRDAEEPKYLFFLLLIDANKFHCDKKRVLMVGINGWFVSVSNSCRKAELQ